MYILLVLKNNLLVMDQNITHIKPNNFKPTITSNTVIIGFTLLIFIPLVFAIVYRLKCII